MFITTEHDDIIAMKIAMKITMKNYIKNGEIYQSIAVRILG